MATQVHYETPLTVEDLKHLAEDVYFRYVTIDGEEVDQEAAVALLASDAIPAKE
jgi:hypothetical protein